MTNFRNRTMQISNSVSAGLLSLMLATNPIHAFSQSARQGPSHTRLQHGTVNILLAMGSELVAVTDSKLSGGLTSNDGFKLYKIDDRTVGMMAGFYSESMLDSAFKDYTALLPEIVEGYIKNPQNPASPFLTKVKSLVGVVVFQLASHFQAMAAADPSLRFKDPDQRLELTVAGYDLDNRIRVAEISLQPVKMLDGITLVSKKRFRSEPMPECEAAGEPKEVTLLEMTRGYPVRAMMRTVGPTLFCEIAGIPSVAEQALRSPQAHPDVLQKYRGKMSGRKEFTADELKALALDLESLTEQDETNSMHNRVGGPAQLLSLAAGRVHGDSASTPNPDVGRSLSNTISSRFKWYCSMSQPLLGSAARWVTSTSSVA